MGDSSALYFSRMPEPELAALGEVVLASRPSEINFVSESGVSGVIKRKAFLVEIIDYSIDVSGAEVHVHTGRRTVGPREGEACCLNFMCPNWYTESVN